MSRPLMEDSEGVLEQSEKPKLEDTQPHDETRRRSMEFDQPGEKELEAVGGIMPFPILRSCRIYARNSRFGMKRK